MREMIEFILFVFVSSVILNGWYLVTRINMVFGFWEKFWEQFEQKEDTDAPKYLFPHFVRYPISQCIICYSSVYGSIIFWTTYSLTSKFASYTILEVILIWISFMLSLAYVNNFLHNKLTSK